jgi:hypothetical protein
MGLHKHIAVVFFFGKKARALCLDNKTAPVDDALNGLAHEHPTIRLYVVDCCFLFLKKITQD